MMAADDTSIGALMLSPRLAARECGSNNHRTYAPLHFFGAALPIPYSIPDERNCLPTQELLSRSEQRIDFAGYGLSVAAQLLEGNWSRFEVFQLIQRAPEFNSG